MSDYVSPWKDAEVRALGAVADQFVAAELTAKRERWETQQHMDREVWRRAGELGLLYCSIPEQYEGGGGTLAHDLIVMESQARAGDTAWGNGVHSGIVAHYILAYGTQEQRLRWLPRLASGELIAAVAMTEPGAGSDLKNISTRAVRDGGDYVIDGAKPVMTNGHTADLIVVVAKTDPAGGAHPRHLPANGGSAGLGLRPRPDPGQGRPARRRHLRAVLRGRARPGRQPARPERGPWIRPAHDAARPGTADHRGQRRGRPGGRREHTLDHVRRRQAFGQSLFDFQNTKFTLAECATTAHVSRVFVHSCIQRHLDGGLDPRPRRWRNGG